MELELDDKRQYLKSYNEYPSVIEFNNHTNHALPQKQISEPYTIIANNKGDIQITDNKSYLTKSVGAITIGIIFGLLAILFVLLSDYTFNDITYRFLILIIYVIFLSLTIVTFSMSIQNINKEKNIFNCNINSVKSLSKLNVDPKLLEKINLPINSALCNGDTFNDVHNSTLKKNFIILSMIVPIVLFVLFYYGLIKNKNPLEFLLESNMKYIIVVLLIFVMISLMVCFKSAVKINNKRYRCDNLTSFNDKINNININIEEKNNLEKKLKENNFNMDSLICVNDLYTYMYEDGYMLKENKQTNNTFDGLLFFTYIVMLLLLISFVFGIILNGNYQYNKVIEILVLWCVNVFCLVSIIYPWALNENPENNKKVNLITGLVSTIIPTIFVIIIIIINALF